MHSSDPNKFIQYDTITKIQVLEYIFGSVSIG